MPFAGADVIAVKARVLGDFPISINYASSIDVYDLCDRVDHKLMVV